MLNLDFSEEQIMLRDMVRGVCAQFAPLAKVRDLEDDADGVARDLWAQLGELGVQHGADPVGVVARSDALQVGCQPKEGASYKEADDGQGDRAPSHGRHRVSSLGAM